MVNFLDPLEELLREEARESARFCLLVEGDTLLLPPLEWLWEQLFIFPLEHLVGENDPLDGISVTKVSLSEGCSLAELDRGGEESHLDIPFSTWCFLNCLTCSRMRIFVRLLEEKLTGHWHS